MRIPSIMYATSLITEIIPMLAHIFYDNFSGPGTIGPKTKDERIYASVLYGGSYWLVSACSLTTFSTGTIILSTMSVFPQHTSGARKSASSLSSALLPYLDRCCNWVSRTNESSVERNSRASSFDFLLIRSFMHLNVFYCRSDPPTTFAFSLNVTR